MSAAPKEETPGNLFQPGSVASPPSLLVCKRHDTTTFFFSFFFLFLLLLLLLVLLQSSPQHSLPSSSSPRPHTSSIHSIPSRQRPPSLLPSTLTFTKPSITLHSAHTTHWHTLLLKFSSASSHILPLSDSHCHVRIFTSSPDPTNCPPPAVSLLPPFLTTTTH